jgi:uncharacterized protein (TIGR02246 family)
MQTLLLAVWLAAAAPAQSGVLLRVDWSRTAERNADLAAVRGEYIAAINARDSERAAALYAPDALAVFGETQALHGGRAVAERLTEGLAGSSGTVTLVPRTFSVNGELGSETGTYTADSAVGHPVEGVYVTVYSRGTEGRWRIAMEVRTGAGKW